MKHYSDIIFAPVITEKSMDLKANNVYVFKANKKASKPQIKKAIEDAFGVKVKAVNTSITKAKRRRVGKYAGETKTYKKAIITLCEGQSIDL